MKSESKLALENLSKTSYRSGLLPIFLGVLVIFIDVINKDPLHVLVGIFIFTVGYAFVKISKKINAIIKDEG